MPRHLVTATADVNAPPAKVYAILADYRDGHPHILPRPPFGELESEQGGQGAGTVVRFQMRVLGRSQLFRGAVTEPEPGRVLVETYDGTGTVTSFIVDPVDSGRRSRVTISTELDSPRGPLGALQRWLMTRILKPVYVRELAQLDAFASSGQYRPTAQS